jgi:predicted enzyme related to lactoylglutathione lyase
MNRPVHFEIHVDDPARAQKFYGEVFGWTFQKWEQKEAGAKEYYMVMTGTEDTKDEKGKVYPGINGGMFKRMGPAPTEGQAVNAFVNTMDVANIDETIAKIEKAGGKVAQPKFAMPGMAYLAYFKDTEGNIFGIWEENKDAK